MKQLLYILLLLSCPAFAQQEKTTVDTIYAYLDGVRFDFGTISYDHQNILERSKINEPGPGRVSLFITRKENRKIIQLSSLVSDIKQASDSLKNEENINVFVDGKLVTPEEHFIEEGLITSYKISVNETYIHGDRGVSTPAIFITTKGRKKKK